MPNYHLTPPELTQKDINRFDRSSYKDAEEIDCWIWIRHRSGTGYGFFKLFAGTKAIRTDMAHRVQFYLTTGGWPPVVRHTCDITSCVNPDHLRGGTQAENIEDMVEKGRQRAPQGVDCHKAILTEDDVRFIRANWQGNGGTYSHNQLAKMFGVSKATAMQVNSTKKSPRTWKHVK